MWLNASGRVPAFIQRDLDDTHLLINYEEDAHMMLQHEVDQWLDSHSYNPKHDLDEGDEDEDERAPGVKRMLGSTDSKLGKKKANAAILKLRKPARD